MSLQTTGALLRMAEARGETRALPTNGVSGGAILADTSDARRV